MSSRKCISQLCQNSIILCVGLFWSMWVIFLQVALILKNGMSYFKSPVPIDAPSCVFDSKYGKSCYKEIKTTKGKMKATTLKMHYMISGETNKDTMLLLHGFPEFWFSWRYQITEFSKTHRVIALDMRGYGLSDKPSHVSDYQLTHLINDIKGVLDSLEIRSVILVAHDWGGVVGWYFERNYPEMVTKYISLNIPWPSAFKNVRKKSFKQFLKSWYVTFFQVPYLPEWTLSRLNYKFIVDCFTSKQMGLKKTKLTEDEILAFQANISKKGSLTCAIDYYRAIFQYPSSELKVPSKSEDTNRYMLIFGESDGAIEVLAATESKKAIPSLTLKLLPGLSHWVQQDDPILVNELMKTFINDV